MVVGFGTTQPTYERRRAWPRYGERAMVAAAHPLAAEAGLEIQRRGGNAFDIAVAAGLAAAVVMPEMCGLGGELFAVFTVAGADPLAIQASGRSPRGASYELMKRIGGEQMPYAGPHSVAVPGMVDAYFHLLAEHGTMSFAEVAEPAIDLARYGYALQQHGAKAIADNAALLAQDPAAAAIFLAHGPTPAAGSMLVQSDLADTLETLAREGRDSFYSGSLATRMVAALRSVGSLFTDDDFAAYESDLAAPYATTYRGQTVYQTALPSQGIILLEALNIVEHGDCTEPLSADAIHLMVEAKKRAYADRIALLGEDRAETIAPMLSKQFARARYLDIDPDRAANDVPAGPLSDGDTTYICAADSAGNMVSLIQSVSAAFGAGLVAGDTGVVMNNRSGRGFSLDPAHPNVYAPGKKSMHTLNAYLIADEQGRPVLVGGTPGGDGQPQWNLQGIVALVDAGLDVQAAIEQPRWTSWPGTDPSTIDNPFELRIENRVPGDIRHELVARGHLVVEQGPWAGGGAMMMIARDPGNGLLIGGADARVDGTILSR